MLSIHNRALFLKIASLKILGTFFALFVYGAFVKLGDSTGYASNSKPFAYSVLTNRTEFTEYFFSSITAITHSVLATHILSSLFVAYCIYYAFKESYYFVNKYVLWLSIMLPHFLIWTGITTKELLSVALFSIFIKQVFNIVQKVRVNKKLLFFSGTLAVFLRPHYGIAYVYLLLSTTLIMRIFDNKVRKHSQGVIFLVYAILFLICLVALYLSFGFWESGLLEVMRKSENYFVHYSGSSTRYNLEWESVSDFISLAPSGIFLSLVGPSFGESLSRPFFFIPFLEGLIFIGICFYLYTNFLLQSLRNNLFFLLFLYAFLPALVILLLAHYPLSVFNPGTALRYKQALIPLMIFFPLLILSLFNKFNMSRK